MEVQPTPETSFISNTPQTMTNFYHNISYYTESTMVTNFQINILKFGIINYIGISGTSLHTGLINRSFLRL
jgi:hypothetical protein